MRARGWLAGWLAVMVIGVALALVPWAAAGAQTVRLAGSFTTIETITDAGKVVGQADGQRHTSVWTFTPTCPSGACATSLHRITIFNTERTQTLTLAADGSYQGSTSGDTANCLFQNGTVRVANGYALATTLALTVTSSDGRGATAYTGTVQLTYTERASTVGNKNCPNTHEAYTFAATIDPIATATLVGPPSLIPASSSATTTSRPAARRSSTPAPAATPGRRSSLTASLHSPATVLGNPLRDLINLLIAFAAITLITFPAQLFNRTLEENYDEIAAGWERRLHGLRRLRERIAKNKNEWLSFAVVSIGGAILGSLLSPNVAFDEITAISFAATLAAIVIGTGLSVLIPRIYRNIRDRDAASHLTALPAGLLIAGVCVLVSRLTNFQPGYLYGVIAGVAFAAKLPEREEAHVVGISHAVSLAISILAWCAWVPVNHAAAASHASWGIVFVDDVLGALVVGGLVGNAINLVPLRFLPGSTLWAWRRLASIGLLALTLAGVVAILLNPTDHPDQPAHPPLITIAVLLAVFGGISIAFAAYWERRRTSAEDDETEEEQTDDGTDDPTERSPDIAVTAGDDVDEQAVAAEPSETLD